MAAVRPLVRSLIRQGAKPVTLRRGGGVIGPPTANMEAWFRKGIGITSAANAVSNWANQAPSGAARDLAQATGANQPTLQAGGSILFDGISDSLRTPAFALAQPETVYLRFRQVTWAPGKRILDGNALNSMGFFQHDGVGPAPSGTPNVLTYAGAYSPNPSFQTIAVNTWTSLAIVYNGVSSSIQNDANAPVTGNPGANNAGGFILASEPAGANWSNIEVAEAIIYSVAHDATTRAAVIAYLNSL